MKLPKKLKNKYNAQSSKCIIGHYHQSIGEAQYCNKLTFLKNAKEIKEIQYQKPYELCVNGQKICNIVVDFVVTWSNGKKEIHEYKGFETPIWNLKHKLFLACYPDIPYIVKRRKDLASWLCGFYK